MARSRLLKPGFYKNEDLAQCTPHARLCFAGLWLLADREGRLEDRPLRIKAELFPYENLDLDVVLNELVARGFIERYAAESERFIAVSKFLAHQTPHVREVASTIPAPTKVVPSTGLAQVQASPRTPCFVSVSVPVSISDPVPVSKTVPVSVAVTRAENARPAARTHRPVNGQSKRPIYRGRRLTVFEWMLDDIEQMLGPAFVDFDCEMFFQKLDQSIAAENAVLPKAEVWPWLQKRVLAEASARGLAIVTGNGTKPHKLDIRDQEARALMRTIS